MGSKNRKTQIWVALIGLIGVLIATLVSNWDKFTTNKRLGSKVSITQSISGSHSSIISNNSGEVNVNK